MTSTPKEPLEEPADAVGGSDDAGAARAPVSGSPAEADSDVGYSRGTGEGQSTEQAGTAVGDAGGTDYLDDDNFAAGPGDSRNG